MAKERGIEEHNGYIVHKGTVYLPAVREQTDLEVYGRPRERKQDRFKKYGKRVVKLAKYSPYVLPITLNAEYARYWLKNPKSKVAPIGGAVLLLAQGWLVAPHSDGEPQPGCTDEVHQQTIRVGEANKELPKEMMMAKNAIRSTYATLLDHHLIGDNRNWSDISATVSQGSYYISADSLKLANQKASFARLDDNGDVEDSLDVGRTDSEEICINLYRPAYGGETIIEDDKTLESIAKKMNAADADPSTIDKTVKQFQTWNPELAKLSADDELQKGIIIQTGPINKNLVFREMTDDDGSLGELKSKFSSLKDSIEAANRLLKAMGKSPDKPGALGYLPFVVKKGEKTISLPQIQAAYTMDGSPVNIKQSPADTQKASPPRNGQGENLPPRIDPLEGSITKATDIPQGIKAAMLRQYKNSKYIPASILAGQIKAESDFKVNAKSRVAKGPAQFTDNTWDGGAGRDGNGDHKKDPFNPDDAFAAQVDEMDRLYVWVVDQKEKGNLHGDTLELTLQAYNRGQGKVSDLGHVATESDFSAGRVPTMETVNYPVRVKKFAKRYGYGLKR